MVDVELSKEMFSWIRAPWSKALIMRVYGRTMGFNYLTFKINALWKPIAKLDCVNLGNDFFFIRFSNNEDYDKVLKGGPWFVGEHFLAIKQWEPYFKASKAKLSSVAMWVRLPKLPIEFYDAVVLREIGSTIGPVLCIDSYTASESRGSYARLCVQVDLGKPLITSVRVGRLVQKVTYEGVSTLCFQYGRLGHKQDSCPYHIKPVVREGNVAIEPISSRQQGTSQVETTQSEPNYGPWMVVTRERILIGLVEVMGLISKSR